MQYAIAQCPLNILTEEHHMRQLQVTTDDSGRHPHEHTAAITSSQHIYRQYNGEEEANKASLIDDDVHSSSTDDHGAAGWGSAAAPPSSLFFLAFLASLHSP